MHRPAIFVPIFFAALCLVSQSSPADAAIDCSGDIDPADPATWTSGTLAYIGKTTGGALDVTGGGAVSSYYGYLGYSAGSTGVVSVDGAGSTWTNSDLLLVGCEGNGTLEITDGGAVSDYRGYLGYSSGSTGAVSVDGAGSTWTNTGQLYVGHEGSGTLQITSGGTVSSYYGHLGYLPGSTGIVNIDGAGSTWTHSGVLYVGHEGSGTLNITRGGALIGSSGGTLGYSSGSMGVVIIDGVGSTWTDEDDLRVGQSGDGVLNITGGATVSSRGGYIGSSCGSTGVVSVDGAGSTWTSTAIYVGYYGTGTLNISGGGAIVSSTSYLGCESGSTGVASIDGAGSTWTNTGHLYVGQYGGSGTLEITDGGAVSAGGDTYVCYDQDSAGTINFGTGGGTLTTKSLLAAASQLRGTGTINARGLVSDVDLVFDSTHVLTQTLKLNSGPDQDITINLDMVDRSGGNGSMGVGYRGNGSLTIRDGIVVSSRDGYLGCHAGSTGVARVEGAGSTWANSGDLYIGRYGNGILNIAGGAMISVGRDTYLGLYPEATGAINFGMGGGTLTTKSLLAPASQLTGTGTINTRGLVSDVELVFDSTHGLTQTITLDGRPGQDITIHLNMSGSAYNNGFLGAGCCGNGSLTIQDGIAVISDRGWLGVHCGSIGVASVDGDGSKWTSRSLLIGCWGEGMLNITGGGAVSSYSGYLGNSSGATGVASIDGTGSTWTNSGYLYVGRYGDGTLNITGGGTVIVDDEVYLGYEYGSTGTVRVNGTDSTCTNGRWLYAGYEGSGTLEVTGGGVVSSEWGCLGYNPGSTGVASVNGVGSTWTNAVLYIGNRGSGSLEINGGGAVCVSGDTYVGLDPESTGAICFGTGGGTLTTGSLLASASQLMGTGTINTRGLVGDVNLVFDSAHGLTQTLTLDSEPDQDITINLDMSGDPDSNGSLGAGYHGNGTLTIRDGITVSSNAGYLGYHPGSVGVASVDGAGSTWTVSGYYLAIGYDGNGTLNITGGGAVNSNYSLIGFVSGSGVVRVDGAGSTWTDSDHLIVGYSGSATLNITGGGTVNSGGGCIGQFSESKCVVRVHGAGSTWNNTEGLHVGFQGIGMLTVANGGSVTAHEVEINSRSLVAIEVSDGSRLTVDGGSGTIDNDGTVRIIAGAAPTVGAKYLPIAAGVWKGSGVYQGIGGSWDETTHEFTASAVVQTASGMRLGFDQATIQRVSVGDSSTGWVVAVSLLEQEAPTPIDFTATAVSGELLDELDGHLDPGDSVLGAWQFDVDGDYAGGEPAYLSFDVGPGRSRDDLQLWHHDGTQWTQFEAWDFTVGGTYASFTVTDLSNYAITPIKEIWIPGDANGDNHVDEADAATLAAHWGHEGNWGDGDFNRDGIIDAADAAILAANWGYRMSEAAATPEPSALTLLVMGIVGLFSRLRRSRL